MLSKVPKLNLQTRHNIRPKILDTSISSYPNSIPISFHFMLYCCFQIVKPTAVLVKESIKYYDTRFCIFLMLKERTP